MANAEPRTPDLAGGTVRSRRLARAPHGMVLIGVACRTAVFVVVVVAVAYPTRHHRCYSN